MKIWQKDKESVVNALAKMVADFTIGTDKQWDMKIANADIVGSKAHARMLCKVGLLTQSEYKELEEGLDEIQKLIDEQKFFIEEEVEDVHSQIELMLTRSKGEVGKKIHSGRSRNDQSLVSIKLFLKSEIEIIAKQIEAFFLKLIELSDMHQADLMPGYTHMQLAMPSSFGLWFGAYAESLSDDLELLIAAHHLINKNPLGSGAGYGSSFPLDKAYTTQLLHFSGMNVNSIYAQMTRGKSEKILSYGISSVASTLSKFCMDICLFMNEHFGFISFPDELTTGSSIMPHKKNPDVFELIRAKCNKIQALPNELSLLLSNLPSGYHRDFQLTKESVFPALDELKNCLNMMHIAMEHIQVRRELLVDSKYDCLFTVEEINKLVNNGIPFRDAYRAVAKKNDQKTFVPDRNLTHTHIGSIGNLRNDLIKDQFQKRLNQIFV